MRGNVPRLARRSPKPSGRVRFSGLVPLGKVAQSVEQFAFNELVVGSIPTLPTEYFSINSGIKVFKCMVFSNSTFL